VRDDFFVDEMAIPTILGFAKARLEVVQGQVGDSALEIVEIHFENLSDRNAAYETKYCLVSGKVGGGTSCRA